MNRISITALTLIASFNVSPAFAEIPTGFSVYGSAAFVGSSTKWVEGTDSLDGLGTDDTTFDFGAEYSFGTENNFAVGAKYLSGFDFTNFVSDGSTVNVKDDGGYALYMSPRLAIGDSTLLVGTLGMFKSDGILTVDGSSVKGDLEGNYYGFGVRHYLGGNNFIEVGMERFNYDSLTLDTVEVEGSATKGLFTYGVTF
jgi:hypothetical protein